MSRLLAPKMPSLPPAPEPPKAPELTAEEKAKIAEDERKREMKRKGRKSTILTGPLGVEEEAKVQKKTLLGE